MAYEFTVPERAFLKLSVGMLEKGWTVAGDGVIIWIYVTPLDQDGKKVYLDEGGRGFPKAKGSFKPTNC